MPSPPPCWPEPPWSASLAWPPTAGSLADTLVYLGLVLVGGYLLTALLTVLPDALDAAAGRGPVAPAATEFKLSR